MRREVDALLRCFATSDIEGLALNSSKAADLHHDSLPL